jgi:hypothetical protein
MMIDSDLLVIILESLGSTDERFKTNIDRFIKISLEISHNSEDFKEEIKNYDDFLCHVYIKDLDFNIWISHSQGKLSYNTNYYENHTGVKRVIHFILKKDTLKRILRQKIHVSEAYMRGLIEIDGLLTDAMMIKNLISYFFKLFKHLINT